MVIKFLIMTFRILPNWITKIVTSVIGKRTKKLKPSETSLLTQPKVEGYKFGQQLSPMLLNLPDFDRVTENRNSSNLPPIMSGRGNSSNRSSFIPSIRV